jgi:hypothetical protein
MKHSFSLSPVSFTFEWLAQRAPSSILCRYWILCLSIQRCRLYVFPAQVDCLVFPCYASLAVEGFAPFPTNRCSTACPIPFPSFYRGLYLFLLCFVPQFDVAYFLWHLVSLVSSLVTLC